VHQSLSSWNNATLPPQAKQQQEEHEEIHLVDGSSVSVCHFVELIDTAYSHVSQN